MSDTEIAQQLLSQSRHMIVAVTLADGTPWAVPVRMVRRDGNIFEWDSRPTTVHSQAIATNSNVALTIFSVEEDLGLYMKARAEEQPNVRREDGYVRYRAVVSEAWLNEQHLKRPVEL
jgi:hypothetical protein